jgi:hypothetical protein
MISQHGNRFVRPLLTASSVIPVMPELRSFALKNWQTVESDREKFSKARLTFYSGAPLLRVRVERSDA